MKKWLFLWMPVVFVVAVIFYSSSQPYEKQNIRSELIQYLDMKKVENLFENTRINYAGSEISVQSLGADGFLEFFIRKAAHFVVFFLLSLFLLRALLLSGIPLRKAFFIVLISTAAYAVTDETHQMFTGNRTPHLADVWLDITGGLSGIVTGIMRYKSSKTKKGHFTQ